MKVLLKLITIFSISIIALFLINCSKGNKDIITLETCDAYPKCDTTHNSGGSISVKCSPSSLDFAIPCYKDSTDTIQFRFMIPIKTLVSLEIVDENENIKQTLLSNGSLFAGTHTLLWKNTNEKDVIGARFQSNNYSKTYWFIK
jgi:hypothetical protein